MQATATVKQVRKRKAHTEGQTPSRDYRRAKFRAEVLAQLPEDPYVSRDVKAIAMALNSTTQKVVSALNILVDERKADFMYVGSYARYLP